ncbi:uncharacterized protein Nmag_2497 [Natrialba magadii ATCC 43099]|uniref:Uncharacterized protein n=1 Tax=Natrialba magadii (strain ATCC 43099 / DSM 3394 / CCM 3739 / CIP 104546 / IAM 13178 / JCM 8861 / NBRC 102185 / NCIMB 2190 / MS3) TaxID=547559 RepID=D3SY86_NATMM|nr:hypothetical protein [Natrialba magadii]ADD06057.1 uncharacterized protein Nmag_2497 [Natrialba magadii ATCC 43099]ELY30946.1 hypothetical protein C500_07908 [Natrialba magadii ATCC 43099]
MTQESRRLLRTADALVYAALVTGVAVVIGIGVSLVRGGGWTTVREATFVLGVLLVTIGTILTRPGVQPRAKRKPTDEETKAQAQLESGAETPTAHQERLAALLNCSTPLTESERLSRGVRFLLAGGLVLVVTFVTEYW